MKTISSALFFFALGTLSSSQDVDWLWQFIDGEDVKTWRDKASHRAMQKSIWRGAREIARLLHDTRSQGEGEGEGGSAFEKGQEVTPASPTPVQPSPAPPKPAQPTRAPTLVQTPAPTTALLATTAPTPVQPMPVQAMPLHQPTPKPPTAEGPTHCIDVAEKDSVSDGFIKSSNQAEWYMVSAGYSAKTVGVWCPMSADLCQTIAENFLAPSDGFLVPSVGDNHSSLTTAQVAETLAQYIASGAKALEAGVFCKRKKDEASSSDTTTTTILSKATATGGLVSEGLVSASTRKARRICTLLAIHIFLFRALVASP